MIRGLYFGCLVLGAVWMPLDASARDFGKHGSIYEIAEIPLFEMIRDNLAALEKAGKLDDLNEELKNNSIATVEGPKAVGGLGEVVESYEYEFDPSVVVREDIDDGRGNLIAAAGTVVNPLEHVALGDALLFIKGDSEAHMELAQSLRDKHDGKVKVILVSGRPLDIMREYGFRVFYDQGGAMVRRFQINNVPSIVTQDGMVLKIREVPADAS